VRAAILRAYGFRLVPAVIPAADGAISEFTRIVRVQLAGH
jgi:hypothetical protein